MKIDRVKLDLSIVAGVLLLVILSILLGFALVGGSLTTDIIKPPINLDYNRVQVNIAGNDLYLSGYNLNVSVAQKGCGCMDTEKGEIKIVDYNLPDVLPLCISQDDLLGYSVTVAVTGGYEPVDGSITLCQKGEYKGTINVVWTNADPDVLNCVEYWTATFTVDDKIILESNQWPDGAFPLIDNPTIPGKEVCLYYETLWVGCSEEQQQFKLIQTH
ncbi:MAG: hypothetical protein ACFFBH_09650 [Promethearchaeota archaeon]